MEYKSVGNKIQAWRRLLVAWNFQQTLHRAETRNFLYQVFKWTYNIFTNSGRCSAFTYWTMLYCNVLKLVSFPCRAHKISSNNGIHGLDLDASQMVYPTPRFIVTGLQKAIPKEHDLEHHRNRHNMAKSGRFSEMVSDSRTYLYSTEASLTSDRSGKLPDEYNLPSSNHCLYLLVASIGPYLTSIDKHSVNMRCRVAVIQNPCDWLTRYHGDHCSRICFLLQFQDGDPSLMPTLLYFTATKEISRVDHGG